MTIQTLPSHNMIELTIFIIKCFNNLNFTHKTLWSSKNNHFHLSKRILLKENEFPIPNYFHNMFTISSHNFVPFHHSYLFFWQNHLPKKWFLRDYSILITILGVQKKDNIVNHNTPKNDLRRVIQIMLREILQHHLVTFSCIQGGFMNS